MSWQKKIIIGSTLVFLFFLILGARIGYPYPLHADEWQHIGIARLKSAGEFGMAFGDQFHLEGGFHLVLNLIDKIVDLVMIYRFLPAIWTALSGFLLFIIIYRKTKDFLVSWLAIIFFASIKSNINLLGLWFFTPLSFAVPFIFLYLALIDEGLEKHRPKLIMAGFLIASGLLTVHAVSVLFSLPVLAVLFWLHRSYWLKQKSIWPFFLLLPIAGIWFYKYAKGLTWSAIGPALLSEIKFDYGWGVLELNNSLLEVYSLIGLILAVIGFWFILKQKDYRRYALYLAWPTITLGAILFYRVFNSLSPNAFLLLAPYQRQMYYFALSLPFLSAIGLVKILKAITQRTFIVNSDQVKITAVIILALPFMYMTFRNYYQPPNYPNLNPYFWELNKIIDDNDYHVLKFLKTKPKGVVMADLFFSTALYPISGQYPLTTIAFVNQEAIEVIDNFYSADDCDEKNKLIEKHNISYIVERNKLIDNCDWDLIYNKGPYIYEK